jgi:hypothetical protein
MYAHHYLGLMTTRAKIEVFAPPSENDTSDYAAGVVAKVGDSADPANESAAIGLCKAISHWEDYQAQWPEAELVSGIEAGLAEWPEWSKGLGAQPAVGTAAVAPSLAASGGVTADQLMQDELNRLENSGESTWNCAV